jgi:hypothetical protein
MIWKEKGESIVKALGALLPLLLALAACSGPRGAATATPWVETSFTVPAPTPAPYWDLLPLDSQPEGGWKTQRMDELNFAFQYPAVYDEVDCGRIFVVEKDEYTLIGFEGGTIRIRMFESWTGDLAEYASEIVSESDVQLLTAVEQFSTDGLPAFRLIYRIPGSSDPDYVKIAFAAFEGRLYLFQYNHMHSIICDAPPLSEEAVYEYILSTVEFSH